MLYNNNYGNGFSYPAPNNGVNYNNWDMNRQTSPGLNSLSNYVPNNQSARVYLKALPVTSLEEAKAAIVDLDGSMYVFVNVSQGEIYTKQYNLANGTSDFLTYKLYQPTNVQPEEYFKKYDDTLRKLVNDVEKLKGENGCYNGGGMWFMWIIVLFALMGGWGNGYGRNGAGLTQVEMQQGFDTQSILRKLDGIQNGLCDGFYAQNSTMLQGFNGTQREILDSRYQLGNQIAENRFAQQQCCCELKSEGYRNTCEITNAIHAEGEATRALIQHNVMQELRDKLADRDRDLMSANFQLSQLSQTANIVGTLRPFPQPAYITAIPYQSVSNYCGYGYGGCGC